MRDSGECRTHRHPSPPPVQTIKEILIAIAGRRVDRLVKRYGNFTAVDGISLRVEAGEFFGFLGPNGAGKTTTINAIVGLARKSAGSIRIFGYDNEREWRAGAAARRRSRRRSTTSTAISRLRDVLIYAAGYFGLRGKSVAERADMLLERFGLTSHSHVEYTKTLGRPEAPAVAGARAHSRAAGC